MSPTCIACGRTLIARALWQKFTPEARERLYRTHARAQTGDMCGRDYNRAYKAGHFDPDVPYMGGWVTVRGIQRPTEPARRSA